MTDEQKAELAKIQQEYSQACMELGQMVYQLSIVQEDVESREYNIQKMHNKIKSLNQRGYKLQQKEVDAVEKPAEAAVEVPNE